MADSTMTAACHVAGSFRGIDRPETDGVVDELHQEVVLLRIAVVDEEPRVDPAPGIEPVSRVLTSDPPPPRDYLPSVRAAWFSHEIAYSEDAKSIKITHGEIES